MNISHLTYSRSSVGRHLGCFHLGDDDDGFMSILVGPHMFSPTLGDTHPPFNCSPTGFEMLYCCCCVVIAADADAVAVVLGFTSISQS